MENFKHFLAVCCLLFISAIVNKQEMNASSGHVPIGFIQFSYVDEGNNPPVIIPYGGVGYSGIPASAVVYDDRTIVIAFSRPVGTADAELQKDDMVVGISHKPSGSDTMTLRLPLSLGDYTIYLYLQDGTTLVGEYTQE